MSNIQDQKIVILFIKSFIVVQVLKFFYQIEIGFIH